MNSVDKTLNCILPSERLTRRYFKYVNTQFESLFLVGASKNQPITSPKCTVIMPRLRQNERDRAFGMLAAITSVTRSSRLFGYSHVTVPNLIRWYNQKDNNIDAPRSG